MADPQRKRCSKCGQLKQPSKFSPHRLECKKCEASRKLRWEAANRARVNGLHRAWAQANPLRAKAIKVKWYLRNRDKILRGLRNGYLSNPSAKCANVRAYNRKNKVAVGLRTKAWVAANPTRARVHWKNRKARKRNLSHTWTAAEAAAAMQFWRQGCAACREPFGKNATLHWDHWVPLIHGKCPGTVAANMVPLCHRCNLGKNRRDASEWLVDRFGARKAAAILRAIAAYQRSIA